MGRVVAGGLALAERLVVTGRVPRVLLVSGQLDRVTPDRLSSGMAVTLLYKPFRPAELLQRVRELLDA